MRDIRTESLNENEQKILQNEYKKSKTSIGVILLLAVFVALVFVVMSGRGLHSPSLASEYGFWNAFPIVLLIVLIIFIGEYFSLLAKLRKDIKKNNKIVFQTYITKKHWRSSSFTIWVASDDSDYRKFELDDSKELAFEQIEKGQAVTLEFTRYSKHLFKITCS